MCGHCSQEAFAKRQSPALGERGDRGCGLCIEHPLTRSGKKIEKSEIIQNMKVQNYSTKREFDSVINPCSIKVEDGNHFCGGLLSCAHLLPPGAPLGSAVLLSQRLKGCEEQAVEGEAL